VTVDAACHESRHDGDAADAPRTVGVPRVCVSGLGFGTAPIGNLYAEVGEEDARMALDRALQLGVRYFDTPFQKA